MNDFNEQLKRAELVTGILAEGAGYTAQLVGGALRVQAIGGTTNDFDIAVIVEDSDELDALHRDLTQIVLPKMGLQFHVQHYSEYGDNEGFLADWRFEDINIIAYAGWVITDHTELVNKFDLNINQWYKNDEGDLVNDHFNKETGLVQINPYRDGLGHIVRLKDRIERFRGIYPFLDWSDIDSRKIEHPIYGVMYE
jgi:hypothetical protein